MKQGLFITFEGIDGCGKTTQIKLLSEWLWETGALGDFILTREPGGTEVAEEIRKVILTPTDEDLDPITEILLYSASRSQHVAKKIRPALLQGTSVICDRFADSTIAFQGYGLRRNLETIMQVTHIATGGLKPDIVFILDLPADMAVERSNQRGHKDRIEKRGLEFQQRCREGFLALAQTSSRYHIIDASRSEQEVQEDIRRVLCGR